MQVLEKDTMNMIFQFFSGEEADAVTVLFETDDVKKLCKAAKQVAKTFGLNQDEVFCSNDSDFKEFEHKLLNSFRNNLLLLVQKTWVEKNDETFKEQVEFKIDNFCAHEQGDYKTRFAEFAETLRDAVFLMFGNQARQKDFTFYALRIDPAFGLFWQLVDTAHTELKHNDSWSQEKYRIFLLLGMIFLANY